MTPLAGSFITSRDGYRQRLDTNGFEHCYASGGGIVGEHIVSFLAEGETLTLSHAAGDRSMFARGAIAAALGVAGRPPGEYDMRDVLGFGGR